MVLPLKYKKMQQLEKKSHIQHHIVQTENGLIGIILMIMRTVAAFITYSTANNSINELSSIIITFTIQVHEKPASVFSACSFFSFPFPLSAKVFHKKH